MSRIFLDKGNAVLKLGVWRRARDGSAAPAAQKPRENRGRLLEPRRESRRQQRRFRRDPLGYLADLEQRCLQLT